MSPVPGRPPRSSRPGSSESTPPAGIPDSVPATTVNKVCGSGLKTVALATQAILLGGVFQAVYGSLDRRASATG